MTERVKQTPTEVFKNGATPALGEAMDYYLEDIRRHFPFTTPEKQVELIERAQAGDSEAREILVGSNTGLSIRFAKYHQGRGVEFTDLVQEGNMALLNATKLYDSKRGEAKFSTYATRAIYRRLRAVVYREQQTISLDDERGLLIRRKLTSDFPNPENVVMRKELRRRIGELLQSLPQREARVLELRFGLNGFDPHTLEEVGQKFGFTRERARQIINKALARLRKPERIQLVEDYA